MGLCAAWVAFCGVAFWLVYLVTVRTSYGRLFADASLRGAVLSRSRFSDAIEGTLGVITVAFLLAAVALISVIALLRLRRALGLAAVGVLILSNVSAQLLKSFVLERPDLGLRESAPATLNSLPGGHSTAAFSVAVALLLVVPARTRGLVALAGGAYSILVALATMVAGWHRASDSVAAFLLVGLWVGVAAGAIVAFGAHDEERGGVALGTRRAPFAAGRGDPGPGSRRGADGDADGGRLGAGEHGRGGRSPSPPVVCSSSVQRSACSSVRWRSSSASRRRQVSPRRRSERRPRLVGMTETDIRFYFDPVCPFAWMSSKWVRQVQAHRDYTVEWRFISLRLINAHIDYDVHFPPEYEKGHTAGLRLLRVAARTRAEHGREAIGLLYAASGRASSTLRSTATTASATPSAASGGDLASSCSGSSPTRVSRCRWPRPSRTSPGTPRSSGRATRRCR